MIINVNSLVSITEANRNFSKVARLVDETGAAIVLKNNIPRYLIIEFDQIRDEEEASEEEVMGLAQKVIARHKSAFLELAK